MSQDETKPAIGSGTNGGTGPTEATAEGGDVAQAQRLSDDDDRQSLASGDDAVEAAIGGGGNAAGTVGSPAISGRTTSEGTGARTSPPDPGDPGGMGGPRGRARTPDNRPPGGVSPIGSGDDS